ncbi:hypothetical protein BDR03DRAFT_935896 [Suillus americanus]|nr:hypothetical protein BDR03DRAFT_935896 [Suillus americanus]
MSNGSGLFDRYYSEFDIIFAGGGTTACVAAGQLAACDSSLKILILEVGEHILNQAAHVQPYQYVTHQVPTIMACTCVPASDFDDWGADGWESQNLTPLMKKLETYEVQPDGPTHGNNGPIRVSYGGLKTGIWEEFVHVGTTYHKRPYANDTDDLETCNTYSPVLVAYCEGGSRMRRYINGKTGKHSDMAHHYVYNQAHNPNLQLWVGKLMKCVIFEDKYAVGVEFTCDLVSCPDADQSLSIIRALKLIVVSARAFGLLAIFERSGIGAEGVLKHCGIEQPVNLPGLSDHNGHFVPYFAAEGAVTLDPLWRGEESVVQESLAQWKSNGKSLITQNGCDAKIKAMGSAFQTPWKEFFQDRPDKAIAIFALCAGYVPLLSVFPLHNYLSTTYITLYPMSVGSVYVKLGENSKEVLDFTMGFLDDPSDIIPLNFGYKRTHEIFQHMPSYRGEVPAGHPYFQGGMSGPVDLNAHAPDIIYTSEDDEVIDKFHHDCSTSSLLSSLGTCTMKPESDQGVIDAWLNMYGMVNLKVADMSIALKNVGMIALLIGEKAG